MDEGAKGIYAMGQTKLDGQAALRAAVIGRIVPMARLRRDRRAAEASIYRSGA
jgi:hypothetical protein